MFLQDKGEGRGPGTPKKTAPPGGVAAAAGGGLAGAGAHRAPELADPASVALSAASAAWQEEAGAGRGVAGDGAAPRGRSGGAGRALGRQEPLVTTLLDVLRSLAVPEPGVLPGLEAHLLGDPRIAMQVCYTKVWGVVGSTAFDCTSPIMPTVPCQQIRQIFLM